MGLSCSSHTEVSTSPTSPKHLASQKTTWTGSCPSSSPTAGCTARSTRSVESSSPPGQTPRTPSTRQQSNRGTFSSTECKNCPESSTSSAAVVLVTLIIFVHHSLL